jgi:demethylmenaquinone methyltransferase/2-methoxy-6-polyprenyl-1,4-benzoquinol methylase
MEAKTDSADGSKKVMVESMFDSIAWRYDFLNHLLSFGVDRAWRRRAIRIISGNFRSPVILDVATGTGDLAIAAMKISPSGVTGIDLSANMLKIAEEKVRKMGLTGKIKLLQGDSENLPFADNEFDVSMVAFGVRNFENPLKGLSEMGRVLRPGGMILVLEFSKPVRFPFRNIYNFYFRRILPFVGKIFSRDKSAYTYLPDSVYKFPDNALFLSLLREAGFSDERQVKLTGGIASIYTALKKQIQ